MMSRLVRPIITIKEPFDSSLSQHPSAPTENKPASFGTSLPGCCCWEDISHRGPLTGMGGVSGGGQIPPLKHRFGQRGIQLQPVT